ncbi:MAG: RNA methyltransferase [Gammaproteobacteria bacterium]|nr:RNA methyltransferase [Gammaproteobacteria bacterium]
MALQLRAKKKRDEHGLFLIEGERELERAIEAGLQFEFVLADKSQVQDSFRTELLGHIVSVSDSELVYVDKSILRMVCYRGTSSKLVGIAHKFPLELSRLKVTENYLVLIAVGLEKPGNLGSVLRSADASGIDAVIVCDQVTDVFNPNVVRSSLGTVFSVPVALAEREEALSWSGKHGLCLVASTPFGKKIYSDIDYTKATAIVVGSESKGLDDVWFESADEVVHLPQLGQSDSLNAAMTATVMLFEARRQRDLGCGRN